MAGNRGYAKFRWDGETHTANTMIGEDYTVDWEYQSPESLDIWIGGKRRTKAAVGDWIVRWAGGGFAVYAPDGKTVKGSTDYASAEPPVDLKAAGTAEQCYWVAESISTVGLSASVESAIRDGWKPVGGVAVSGGKFLQAMWRPAGWKAWTEPVGSFPPAGQSPAPKASPEFRPEEDGTIQPQPAKAEVPPAGFSSRGQPYVDLPVGGLAPNTTTINTDWFKTPESAGAVPPRKGVDPAEERRLIAWLSGLAKEQPGWVADWVYKTAVGMKPHATIHLNTDDVNSSLFTGYGYALRGTAEILFPWADLSVKPRRPVKPS